MEMKQNIYVISGLGADRNVFQKIQLEKYNLVYIHWVAVSKSESMNTYAKHLLPQIKEENPLIMGVSLGGMLALEIAKLIPVKKVISVSSIISYDELPFHFQIASKLRLQKILPIYTFSKGNKLTYWLFGATNEHNRKILKKAFENLDKAFLYWALNAILTWGNRTIPKNFYRIHGTSDLILPQKKRSNYDFIIENGSHLMILEKYQEISYKIEKILKS